MLAAAMKAAFAVMSLLSIQGCHAEESQAAALRALSSPDANFEAHAVMVIVQERECLSRESDLRMIRSVIRPSHIGLLPENGREASPAVAQFVAEVLEVEPGSHMNLRAGSVQALKTLGLTATPVVVVRSASSETFMAFTASTNRRILRRQLLAARTLIED